MQTYSLQDLKGANGFSFSLVDGVEPIFGVGNDIKGKVDFDVNNPEKSKGEVEIGMKSLKLTSADMTASMQGGWCLDIEKYPTAKFVVTGVKIKSKTKEGAFTGTLTGNLTIKDVTKSITVEGKARLLPGAAKVRYGDKEGDLMMLSSEFDFDRHDFNIAKDFDGKVIGTRVRMVINCAATSFK